VKECSNCKSTNIKDLGVGPVGDRIYQPWEQYVMLKCGDCGKDFTQPILEAYHEGGIAMTSIGPIFGTEEIIVQPPVIRPTVECPKCGHKFEVDP